jgi:hypothetical protein
MRDYWRSCLISAGVALLIFAVGSIIPRIESIGLLLAPGMYGALLLFPGGPHGYWPLAYVGFALIIDVLLYGYAVLWVWRLMRWFRAHR